MDATPKSDIHFAVNRFFYEVT